MSRLLLAVAGVAGFLAVAAGAFGAHALSNRLSAGMLETFKTGAHYHLVHALALLALAFFADRGWPVQASAWCFVAGIVLFSGSLYALSLSGVTRLGMITPLGGLCFLAGWALLVVAAVRSGG